MLRTLFIILTSLHGLIHLLGWVKAFDLAQLPQFTHPISRPPGILWLLTALLWIATALLLLFHRNIWWMLAATALLLSQALVLMYWQDAKYGTIANLIILIGIAWGFGNWSFNRMVTQDIEAMMSKSGSADNRMSRNEVSLLPPIVQKWVLGSGMIEKQNPQSVHLYQKGTLKTSPEGKWLSVEAEQWFTLESPGFVWHAKVGSGSLTPFSGRDKFVDEKGSMLIKLFSLLPVVDAEDQNIDKGAALRFLAEMVWFPSAALTLPIKWEELSTLTAKATMRLRDFSVTGTFTFNEKGQVTRFEAPRYYQQTNKTEFWVVEIDENSYTSMAGFQVPTRAKLTWRLPEGDFTWYRLSIEKIEYE